MIPEIPEKLFFKIGEVTEVTEVEQHVLRYWEDEFDHLRPEKNRSGQRLYQKKDIEQILMIKKLLYEDKYTIAGARKKLKSKNKTDRQLNINYNPEEILKWRKSLKVELKNILKILG
tara:strand:- start:6809 stop:7159 length:351 start_codon:yes stop_codon:yes gene_type:complete